MNEEATTASQAEQDLMETIERLTEQHGILWVLGVIHRATSRKDNAQALGVIIGFAIPYIGLIISSYYLGGC